MTVIQFKGYDMIFEMGDLKLWLNRNYVTVKRKIVTFEPLEYRVLKSLCLNSTQYLDLCELHALSGARGKCKESLINVTLLKVKRKLAAFTKSPVLQGVYGLGHK